MAARCEQLVGRDSELTHLRTAVDSLGESHLKAIELVGEPGIGKTSLLNCLHDDAQQRRVLCLRACGSRSEQDHVFGALIALLDDILATDEMVSALGPQLVADLASVLPGLRPFTPEGAGLNSVDTLLVCRAVRQALAAVSAAYRGLLILVDDMQWVDEATTSVIGYLIRHGVTVPALLVTARRRRQADIVLTGPEQVRSGEVEVMELGPIDSQAVDLLLADVPPDDREALVRSAGGNPFFVTQLACHASSAHDLELNRASGSDSVYPPAVTATILDELAATPHNARLLAHAGAVLGEPFEVLQAGELAELSSDETYRAIDLLLERTLVAAADNRGGFRFRHPVIASVIYESIGAGWRLAAHARAAGLLTAAGAGTIAVARHLECSATVGDVEAVDRITEAAQDARAMAPRTSARLYGSAERLVPAAGPLADRRPMLLLGRADALILCGQFTEARDLLQQALTLVPPGDELLRGSVLVNIIRAERWLGERDAVAERIIAILEDIPAGPSFERVSLEGMLLLAESDRRNLPAVRELTASLSMAVAELDLPILRFFIACDIAIGESHIGSAERARAACREASNLWNGFTADERVVTVEGLLLLSSAELLLALWDDAATHSKFGLKLSRANSNQEARIWFCLVAESAMTHLGRPTATVDVLDEAEQLARMQGNPSLLVLVLSRRSAVAAMLGDQSKALTLAREAELYLDLTPDDWVRASAALLVAPILTEAGLANRAVELVLSTIGGDSMLAITATVRSTACEILAVAEIALGNLSAAREWADRACDQARIAGLELSHCHAQRAVAAVALAADDAAGAIVASKLATAAADAAEAPIEAARARVLAGQALAMAHRRAEAVEMYQLALTEFDAAGTRRLAAQVTKELRALGVRTSGERSARGSTGLPSLSDRESQVAQLVADGLTNRQIADELVLSSRTVESHLRRIFIKLDAHSRADVVSAVERDRILSQSSLATDVGDEVD